MRVTRVGVIGDVHTESAALQRALNHFAGLSLDRVVCTGDVADGPLDAAHVVACCELLQEHRVLTVSGNHDRWLQDGELREATDATDPAELPRNVLDFLEGLPTTAVLESPLGPVLLCHGIGDDDMTGVQPYDHGLALEHNAALSALLREGRYRFVINGHTHRPMVRTIGAITLINAGTLLRDHNPCCAVVDFSDRSVRFLSVLADGVRPNGSPSHF